MQYKYHNKNCHTANFSEFCKNISPMTILTYTVPKKTDMGTGSLRTRKKGLWLVGWDGSVYCKMLVINNC